MSFAQKILRWEQTRHKTIVLVLRVMVGIIITLKGITFLGNSAYLDSLLRHSALHRFAINFWIYYIIFGSLLCGILLILGLFTRLALFLQIPVLLGAVFFINQGKTSFALNGEFALSLLVLGLLFFFLFKGPGEISMDNFLRNHEL